MRIVWLSKKSTGRVVIFFNGWGMDAGIVSKLETMCDVVMFYDYRTLSLETFPSFQEYEEIYIVAWSMGVWAASHTIPLLEIEPTLSVALNGTECPVDDRWGIPRKIYELTERGMNEQGREKFFIRMFDRRLDGHPLEEQKSLRKLQEVREELSMIREQAVGGTSYHKWDKVYVSEKDVIFPMENQLNWWKDRAPVVTLHSGHCPFGKFKSWEEIIGK